jgi:hypothetical protein
MSSESNPLPAPVAALGLLFMLGLMMLYTIHCVGVSADMYSAPSIVLQVRCFSVGVLLDVTFTVMWLWHSMQQRRVHFNAAVHAGADDAVHDLLRGSVRGHVQRTIHRAAGGCLLYVFASKSVAVAGISITYSACRSW